MCRAGIFVPLTTVLGDGLAELAEQERQAADDIGPVQRGRPVPQVGQRVGTAVGVAAASATFFSTLYAEASGDGGASLAVYHDGFRNGFLVTIGLVAVALAIGLVDLAQRRRRERAETA